MKLLSIVENILSDELNDSDDIIVPPEKIKEFEAHADKVLADIRGNIADYTTFITNMRQKLDDWESGRVAEPNKDILIPAFSKLISDYDQRLKWEQQQLVPKDVIVQSEIKAYKQSQRYKMDLERSRAEKKLSNEDFIDIFVTALEGGSNYWYFIKDIPTEVRSIQTKKSMALSEALGDYVLHGGGVHFYDVEDENEYLGKADLDSILDAVNIIKRDYPDIWNSMLDENVDGDAADVFLQLCVMGDVVYG